MDKAEMTFKISLDSLDGLMCVLLSSIIQCFSVVNSMDGSLDCFCVLQFYLNSNGFYLIQTRVLLA